MSRWSTIYATVSHTASHTGVTVAVEIQQQQHQQQHQRQQEQQQRRWGRGRRPGQRANRRYRHRAGAAFLQRASAGHVRARIMSDAMISWTFCQTNMHGSNSYVSKRICRPNKYNKEPSILLYTT